MPRCKAFPSPALRWWWSNPVPRALALCALTFCVVLPLCCHRLLYSYYFLRSAYLDPMSERVLRESRGRGQAALDFWRSSAPSSSSSFRDVAQNPELLVTVVTARRNEGRDFHYLLQVMLRLSSIVGDCSGVRCAEVLLCDVERGPHENQDAKLLEPHFLVVRRDQDHQDQDQDQGVNTFEKEKRDYAFCLRRGWELLRPRNVVVLEDDALPRPDFFPVLAELLSRRFARRSLYVKLYHPERLQRYWNPEPYRLLEWAGLGSLAASLFLLAASRWGGAASPAPSAGRLLFFTAYFMAAAELVGRHYLLEARRLSPQLYAVAPATECCTPAVLYPGNASLRVAEYLDRAACVRGRAKDMVLYRMARTVPGGAAHSLEPNLITHIGAYSSVRANPARPRLL